MLKNAIVVMTSNLTGPQTGKPGLGFIPDCADVRAQTVLREAFSPEFLGRIDCVASFRPLAAEDLAKIAALQLRELAGRLQKQNVTLETAPELPERLGALCANEPGGARSLRRRLQTGIEGPAAELLLRDPSVRTLRAVILAAILSLFFAVVISLLWELSCDSIWLPATLRRRYGLKDLGTVHSAGFAENVKYLLQKATERKNIGNKDTGYKSTGKVELTAMVCGILPGEDPAEVISQLRTAVTAEDVKTSEEWQFTAVPSPLLCPESAETLRGADAVILAVPAGSHVGKQLEAVLEYLAAQDCTIDGALLWNADEELIRRYYFLPGGTQE